VLLLQNAEDEKPDEQNELSSILSLQQARKLIQRIEMLDTFRKVTKNTSEKELWSRLKRAFVAGFKPKELPIWWNHEVHSLSLIYAILKYGIGRWDKLKEDESFPFARSELEYNKSVSTKKADKQTEVATEFPPERTCMDLLRKMCRFFDTPEPLAVTTSVKSKADKVEKEEKESVKEKGKEKEIESVKEKSKDPKTSVKQTTLGKKKNITERDNASHPQYKSSPGVTPSKLKQTCLDSMVVQPKEKRTSTF